MTAPPGDTLALLREINASAAGDRWAGIEVTAADTTTVELRLPSFLRDAGWRSEAECEHATSPPPVGR